MSHLRFFQLRQIATPFQPAQAVCVSGLYLSKAEGNLKMAACMADGPVNPQPHYLPSLILILNIDLYWRDFVIAEIFVRKMNLTNAFESAKIFPRGGAVW
jgi:hypothetical protein